jgi:hypothetical protein
MQHRRSMTTACMPFRLLAKISHTVSEEHRWCSRTVKSGRQIVSHTHARGGVFNVMACCRSKNIHVQNAATYRTNE